MNQSAPRPFWQFSIREFLLAVAAVSGLFALYAQQRTFKPTKFSSAFNATNVVDEAMKRLHVVANGGTGGGGSRGSSRVSLSYRGSYAVVSGETTPSAVLEEIETILEKQLLATGCQIGGQGTFGAAEDDSLMEFELNYYVEDTRGFVRVRSTIGQNDRWQFWFDIFEY